MTGQTLITKASKYPVTWDELQGHLRIDESTDEALITGYLAAATSAVEKYLDQCLISQTWRMFFDRFPHNSNEVWWDGVKDGALTQLLGGDYLELPKFPLISVTHIKTYADDDTATTFAATSYHVDTSTKPGKIVLKNGNSWPSFTKTVNGIEVEALCGYGGLNDIPEDIRLAVMMTTAAYYENRGGATGRTTLRETGDIPKQAKGLLDPHTIARVY